MNSELISLKTENEKLKKENNKFILLKVLMFT